MCQDSGSKASSVLTFPLILHGLTHNDIQDPSRRKLQQAPALGGAQIRPLLDWILSSHDSNGRALPPSRGLVANGGLELRHGLGGDGRIWPSMGLSSSSSVTPSSPPPPPPPPPESAGSGAPALLEEKRGLLSLLLHPRERRSHQQQRGDAPRRG
uniref:Uncharacterized protein n=1 Tax=Setaria viridis TaxID=4556 RepID=A0A4U6U878_SETVI|nr:hypothetical protein SEVIR_6G168250v2 [Setaria viridis]